MPTNVGYLTAKTISGVYKITNKINGKVYIGESRDILSRWREHYINAYRQKDIAYNYPLQIDIRKYDISNFSFEVLEENIYDKKELHILERHYIDLYNSYHNGYNQNSGFSEKIQVRSAWSEEEVLLLQKLINEGLTQKEIGNRLGRTESSINSKISRLGLGKIKNFWDKNKEQKMLQLRNSGFTQSQVAEELGFSKEAVKKRWHDVFSKTEGAWK